MIENAAALEGALRSELLSIQARAVACRRGCRALAPRAELF